MKLNAFNEGLIDRYLEQGMSIEEMPQVEVVRQLVAKSGQVDGMGLQRLHVQEVLGRKAA